MMGNHITDKEPTCTEDGSITVSCLNCGAVLSSEVIKATGNHDWDYNIWVSNEDQHWVKCKTVMQHVMKQNMIFRLNMWLNRPVQKLEQPSTFAALFFVHILTA